MRRGGKAVSQKWRVTFENIAWFDELPLDDLEVELEGNRHAKHVLANVRSAGGGQFDETAWSVVLDAVQRLRPEARDELQQLVHQADHRRPGVPAGDREPILLYEHDAVGLALEFTGIDRRPVLESWRGTDDAPFLRGLDAYTVGEDRAIEYDATVFGGWRLLGRNPAGFVRFHHEGREVTIINVNRAGVERALGVDLVYYHHYYDAYVLTQYKRMRSRPDGSGAEYRPDDQLGRELERLRAIRSDAQSDDPLTYRLEEETGYLKLCSPTAAPAFSHELVRGMYLPVTYWDMLVASGQLSGPRGGTLASYENVTRYLTNTEFIALVQSGWIGSRGVTSTEISEVIHQSLRADHSLILAEAEGVPQVRRHLT